MTVVLLYTGIDDLFKVKVYLKSVVDWQSLGLALGLLYPTLKRIKNEQHGNISDCMMGGSMAAATGQCQSVIQRVSLDDGSGEMRNSRTLRRGQYCCWR